eukprot:Hpha_TRINITY_DN16121_c2_g2::TRINITY_DN16121_c2_g2_i2::g.4220::m.4220
MTLSQKGILQLQRLSSRLLGLGGVDLAETVERVQTGDTGACLAVMGYLLDATYSSVLLHWMRQHEWFVPFAGTDADFVTQIWRLLREEGLTPAVTVRQFLSPRYAEAKVSILTSFVALLHKKAAALSRTRRGTTPSSSTFSSVLGTPARSLGSPRTEGSRAPSVIALDRSSATLASVFCGAPESVGLHA